MEETAVHGAEAELTDRAGVAVGQNALGAELGGDVLEAGGDLVQRLIPGDALEELGLTALGEWPFRHVCATAHGIEQALGGVDAVQVARDLAAEKSARDGMRGIAGNLDGAAGEFVHGDQNAAGVRAVVRADGVHSSRLVPV